MTWNQRRNWKNYCSEPLDKIEHYEEASAEDFKGWCIHHRLEIQPDGTIVSRQELKSKVLYYNRPAEELVFMRFREHATLHKLGNAYMKGHKHSADTRNKLSQSLKGKSPWNIGKQLSTETRLKLSAANKGKHWWNDGVSCKYSRECPGPEWKPGRIFKP